MIFRRFKQENACCPEVARRDRRVRRVRPRLESLEGRSLLTSTFGAAVAISDASPITVTATAVDAAGSRYVTGWFQGTANFTAGNGSNIIVGRGGRDAFVAKYSASGNLIWNTFAASTADDEGTGIALDGQGNVYVTGYISGTAAFKSGSFFDPAVTPTINVTGQPGGDTFLWKLTADKGFNVFAEAALGSSNRGLAIAADAAGNAFLTGRFSGPAIFGNTAPISAGGTNDVFVARAAPDGRFLWARSFAGSAGSTSQGNGIALDSADNVYTTGSFTGTSSLGGSTPISAAGGNSSLYVSQLRSDGSFGYARAYQATGLIQGQSIGVDSAGRAVVAGQYQGTATFGGTTLANHPGPVGVFVAKFDGTGSPVYADDLTINNAVSDLGKVGLAVDPTGTAFVVGTFSGSVFIAGIPLQSRGTQEAIIVRVSNDGVITDATQAGGANGAAAALAVASNGAGGIVVAGTYTGTPTIGSTTLPAPTGASSLFLVNYNSKPATFIPIPGDYYGEGRASLAIYSPRNGIFEYARADGSDPRVVVFGGADPSFIPIPGDYFGEGKTSLAIYSPKNGLFEYAHSDGSDPRVVAFGGSDPSFIPIPGDYFGEGKTSLAIYSPKNGIFEYARPDGTNSQVIAFGGADASFIPIPGDYNRIRRTNLAIYSPKNGIFIFANPDGTNPRAIAFGGNDPNYN